MPVITKTVKHEDTKEEVTQSHAFPDTVQECVDKYGEKVVLGNFLVGAGTALRNRLFGLTHNKNRVSREAAIEATKDWAPGVASERVAKDPMAAYLASLAGMSEEDRIASITQLQARAQADMDNEDE
jgi:hypothetical protein